MTEILTCFVQKQYDNIHTWEYTDVIFKSESQWQSMISKKIQWDTGNY